MQSIRGNPETISDRAWQLAHAVRNVFRQVGRVLPSFQALALDAKAQNKLSLLSSCKLQQGSVEQCICAGQEAALRDCTTTSAHAAKSASGS